MGILGKILVHRSFINFSFQSLHSFFRMMKKTMTTRRMPVKKVNMLKIQSSMKTLIKYCCHNM